MKLTLAVGLVIVDMMCARAIFNLTEQRDHSRGIHYKILHGLSGLLLIGVLISIYVVRDKEGEIIDRYKKSVSVTESQRYE